MENKVYVHECKKGQTVTLLIKSVVENQALVYTERKKGGFRETLLGVNLEYVNQFQEGATKTL